MPVQVANYCRDKIHVVLREVLRAGRGLGELGEVDVKEPWEKVFGDCFQKVDDEVSGKASRLSNGRPEPIAADNVGSTAVVAIVCSSHVITANCGDSRVVLCRGKEPIALSVDHKPDRKDERARIEAAGGKVIDWNGYRVSGILAMSRSIGDRYLKPFLIPKPEVSIVARAKDDDCLILASDGLWDVMSNEDACKVARRQILLWYKNNNDGANSDGGSEPTMNPAAKAAADCLVRLALSKGSGDNISVIVIDLKSRKKPKGKS
uniref:protein-serine/threonine phosphatase n=1 Tax=Aegilops tauschii subsp. strangulata TaxID=200361 RepID=A0A453F8J7_AEGTS